MIVLVTVYWPNFFHPTSVQSNSFCLKNFASFLWSDCLHLETKMSTGLQPLFEYVGMKINDVSPSILKKSTQYNFQFQKAIGGDNGVVLLMGWFGCSDRYLKKYSEVLSDMGWSSLRIILPGLRVFNTYQSQFPYAATILDLILETGLHTNRKLVLMAFSNNGAVIMEKFNTLLFDEKYTPILKNIVGVVYDSAPAYMHLMKGAEAIRVGVPNFILGWIISLGFMFLAVIYSWRPPQFWKYVGEVLPDKPYLYFYCMNDTLTDHVKLEELIEEQKSKTKITVKKWDESIHCTHLVKHKEEYTQALKAFLESL
eukprot:TRINITY_DN1391_c2_g1_i1.p1 TRINITY_DN1391_c2_g1~~TRINITY_DN1391_c2_g1_i1.p1  ORF type:complete len:319 (-),score=33.47 TRINITY_DN1391_c2_g1_i1:648-1583(-)